MVRFTLEQHTEIPVSNLKKIKFDKCAGVFGLIKYIILHENMSCILD